LVTGPTPDANNRSPCVSDFAESVAERLRKDGVMVRSRLGRAAEMMKARYDNKIRPAFSIAVGDVVWYYCPRRYSKLSPEWQNLFTGPFAVVRLLDPCNLVIRRCPRGREIVVHRDKIKPLAQKNDIPSL